jgi:Protein of unknown function, DUF255
MTCVLDHDRVPFFAGTYFPDGPRQSSPSFRQVLEALSDAWRNRGDDVGQTAEEIRRHLQVPGALPVGALGRDALARAVGTLAREFDPANAGFGGAPKFPPSMALEFLLRNHARTGDPLSKQMLDATCVAMARGGLYDQLGGGFARYSVDAGWVVPHFEKMLYDNAELLGLFARWGGHRVAGDSADFLLRALRPRRAASPARWTRTPRGSRGSSTPGHRRSRARRSATRTARGRRRSSRSPRRAPTTHPHSNPETNPSSNTVRRISRYATPGDLTQRRAARSETNPAIAR